MWLDKVKVLVVDDHQPNLIALEQVLLSPTLDIQLATSGQEALEMMLTNEYAIVLLDVNMPEMDGFEVAKLMKARKETRHLPISFVTAINKEKKYVVQGYDIGAVDYLYKPLEPDTIKSKVSVFVELFRLRKQSESRLKVIQSSIDGIAILNSNLRFVSLNDALIDMLGYQDESELEGGRYGVVLDRHAKTKLPRDIRHILSQDGKWLGELRCKTKQGQFFPAEVSVSQSSNNIICIVRDITQRKAAEKETKMLQSVVENANDVVVVTGPMPEDHTESPTILYVNAAFERVTGYTKEEVLGKNPRFLQGEKTDRHQLDLLKKSLIEGKASNVELLNYSKDGREYFNDIRIVPIKNAGGEVEYFTAIQRDTTYRKKMEEELKRVNKELENFTYITSHDLRSPLMSIKGFSGELEEAIESLNPVIQAGLQSLSEEEREKTKSARDSFIPTALKYLNVGAEKMESITGLLLELSRTGRRELHFELVDVNELVQACLDAFGYQIKQQNVAVSIEPLPDVVADPSALAQVFGNLVDNAIKYLDPSRSGKIVISGKVTPTETVYSIRDNGRGIAKNQMHKVFEVFRRVGDVKHISGEGMGMAFVKSLLNRHEGRIWCESTVDEGTTFFFNIRHNLDKSVEIS